MTEVGVIVTRHASDALRRRDPDLAKRCRDVVPTICFEVHEAIRQGRIAAHRPRWTRQRGGPQRRKDEKARAIRYATNAAETRCYVLTQARKSRSARAAEFKKAWIVMSVLVRHNDEREERAA